MKDNTSADPITIAFQLGFGPALFPLAEKIPIQKEWQKRPPVTESIVREWLALGHNIGLRCGVLSDIFVIDDDRPKYPGDKNSFELPPSDFIVRSPTGSEHRYYCLVDGIRNSAGKYLGEHIDVRGEGGYVVYAGSVHPEHQGVYEIVACGVPSPCSDEVVAMLLPKPASRVAPTYSPPTQGTSYAKAAFASELDAVQAAPDGTRNDQLNRSAFSLGQLVGGGLLDENKVVSALEACFPGEKKAAGTIQRGINAGIAEPRGVPETTGPVIRGIKHGTPPARGAILVPGSHELPNGDNAEQHALSFNREITKNLDPGSVYRRGEAPGTIIRGAFRIADTPIAKEIVAANARTVRMRSPSKADRATGAVAREVFEPLSTTDAVGIISYWSRENTGVVRDLRAIIPHPCFIGPDWISSRPGWNTGGVYITHERASTDVPLESAVGLLNELVCDFQWQSPSDKIRYFGLLLTPIIRHAIRGAIPMHLIGAPDINAGKSLLGSTIFGEILLGESVPVTPFPDDEAEAAKVILALVIQAAPIICFDNLAGRLDSAVMAALLTSRTFQGRILGRTQAVAVEHESTIIATGNNTNPSPEIARRIIAVLIHDRPQDAPPFVHPDLGGWARDNRGPLLDALCALVRHWLSLGAPTGRLRMGSFEGWSGAVSGILEAAGMADYSEGLEEWRDDADTFKQAAEVLVDAFWDRYGSEAISPRQLIVIADTLGIFEEERDASSDHGKRCRFGRLVVKKMRNRIYHGKTFHTSQLGRGPDRARVWLE